MRLAPFLGVLMGLCPPLAFLRSLTAFCAPAFVRGETTRHQGDDGRLVVNIRNRDLMNRASSCMNVFSRIELVNKYRSDVKVESVEIVVERIVRIGTSGDEDDWELVEEVLPQQLRVSNVMKRAIRLEPDQAVLVPLTFLPRFPYPDRTSNTFITLPESLNAWQQADREEWLGLVEIKSNQWLAQAQLRGPEERYHISSTVVIETNMGTTRHRFDAYSNRANPYGLPDTILFDKKRHASTMAPAMRGQFRSSNGIRILHSFWNPSTTQQSQDEPDCYDLYIKHPDDADEDFASMDLEVHEILVSRPQNLSVQVLPEKASDAPLLRSAPQHVIRIWTEDGPLRVPNDGAQHYVATICSDQEGVTPDPETEAYVQERSSWMDARLFNESLGFVQVRTDTETLFIAARSTRDGQRRTARVHYRADPSTSPFDSDIFGSTASMGDIESTKSTSLVLPVYLMEETGNEAVTSVTLSSHGDSPNITIMKASIAMDEGDVDQLARLDIVLTIEPRGIQEHNFTVRPGRTIPESFNVRIGWNPSLLDGLDKAKPLSFLCKLLVQGSTQHTTVASWTAAAGLAPDIDADAITEIPMIVRYVQGRIWMSLEETENSKLVPDNENDDNQQSQESRRIFFPQRIIDAVGFDSPGVTNSVLRIMSSTHENMTVIGSEILVRDGEKILRPEGGVCSRFNVSHSIATPALEEPGTAKDLGSLSLNYSLPESTDLDNETAMDTFSTECLLRVRTFPESGLTLLPLIIFTAQLSVTTVRPLPGDERETSAQTEGKRSIAGFPQFQEWYQSSKAGKSLGSILASGSNRRGDDSEAKLTTYIEGLSNSTSNTLQPVVLKFGAIHPEEEEVVSFHITNHNPMSTVLKIEVGSLERMRVTLGRDSVVDQKTGSGLVHLFSQMRRKSKSSHQLLESGSFKGHPLEGLKQFLLTDTKAQSIFSFGFRDAIYKSSDAIKNLPLLEELYDRKSVLGFHDRALGDLSSINGVTCHDNSISHGKFVSSASKRPISGPVLVSIDSKMVRRVRTCDAIQQSDTMEQQVGNSSLTCSGNKQSCSEESDIVIPPGGVARLEVAVRSPPLSALDRDITQFLATGLVVSSNLGEVFPILATFDAPRGKLDVAPLLGVDTHESFSPYGSRAIRVPTGLFSSSSPEVATVVNIPPKAHSFDELAGTDVVPVNASAYNNAISLYMRSSFNRDIELLKVSSCNPWFEVILRNTTSLYASDPILGVNIGTVKSVVPCKSSIDDAPEQDFASFFRCALNWIIERSELQPQGCGSREYTESHPNSVLKDNASWELIDFERSIKALNRAILISSWSMGNLLDPAEQQLGYMDGNVHPVLVDTIANAWDVLRAASESNLLHLSTSLRALVRYNSTASDDGSRNTDMEGHLLSVAMRNLTIDSVLEIPSLVDTKESSIEMNEKNLATLRFPDTFVASTSSMKIPLKNPTAATVRVRLAVPPEHADFVAYSKDSILGVDRGVRGEFLTKHGRPYTQRGPVDHPTEMNYVSHQWWDGGGSFFLPDMNGGLLRAHYNISVRAGSGTILSLMNPTLIGNVAFITGCAQRCGVREETSRTDDSIDLRMISPIGAAAAEKVLLVGREHNIPSEGSTLYGKGILSQLEAGSSMATAGRGPEPFAIPSYALLDEVQIPPYGSVEIGPILFRPPGKTKYLGCESGDGGVLAPHCQEREFTSSLFIENSLTGLERVVLRGRSQWERVIFLDNAPDSSLDAFSDIEMRNGRNTLVFPGMSSDGSPVVKELIVKNVGDVRVTFRTRFLTDTSKLNSKARFAEENQFCSFGEFTLMDCKTSSSSRPSIELDPGQTFSIMIKHRIQCSQPSFFASLVLEYDRTNLNEFGGNEVFARRSSRKSGRRLFRRMSEVIDLGFTMSRAELGSCKLALTASSERVENLKHTWQSGDNLGSEKHTWLTSTLSSGILRAVVTATSAIFAFMFLLATLFTTIVLMRRLLHREVRSKNFRLRLVGPEMVGSSNKSEFKWLDTLRCLSRVDPSSNDLHMLGREQTRIVLLGHFRHVGIFQPLCLSSSGQFLRERAVSIGKPAISSSGSERIRTISDALFRQSRPVVCSAGGSLSVGFGWRVAVARGILDDTFLMHRVPGSRTESLLSQRTEELAVVEQMDEESSGGDDPTERSYFGIENGGVDDDEEQEEEAEGDYDDTTLAASPVIVINESTKKNEVTVAEADSRGDKVVHHIEMKASVRTSVAPTPVQVNVKNEKCRASVFEQAEHDKAISKPKPIRSVPPKKKEKYVVKPVVTKVTQNLAPKDASRRKNSNSNHLPDKQKPTPAPPTKKDSKEKTAAASRPRQTSKPKEASKTKESAKIKNSQKPPKPPTRPPPGLRPPPGFEGAQGNITPLPSLDLLLPVGGAGSISLQDQNQAPDTMDTNKRVSGEVGQLPVAQDLIPTSQTKDAVLDSQPAAGSLQMKNDAMEGFDILDFLDSILNDPASEHSTGSPEQQTSLPLPSSESNRPKESLTESPQLTPIPLNPWATGRSRASAYGINLFEDSGEDQVVDIPLLTPAAILGQDDEDKRNLSYSSTSFYTNLLK